MVNLLLEISRETIFGKNVYYQQNGVINEEVKVETGKQSSQRSRFGER